MSKLEEENQTLHQDKEKLNEESNQKGEVEAREKEAQAQQVAELELLVESAKTERETLTAQLEDL